MYENKALEELFDQYVPVSGKAGTMGGELVRAVNRLLYRYYNDGDLVGEDYGNETCNAPARFIDDMVDQDTVIPFIIEHLWATTDPEYEEWLCSLGDHMVAYLEVHCGLFTEPCTFDMWDWRKPEDFDYDDEEDKEW